MVSSMATRHAPNPAANPAADRPGSARAAQPRPASAKAPAVAAAARPRRGPRGASRAVVDPTLAGLPAGLGRVLQPDARSQWLAASVRSYTPEMVEMLLRLGLSGDLASQWQLFQLMEDTWPRLNKNLLELKRSVASLGRTVIPALDADAGGSLEPRPEALRRARLVERALAGFSPLPGVDENGFPQTVFDLLDAWGKGVAVLELDWEIRAPEPAGPAALAADRWIAPRSSRWVSPFYYGYSAQDGALGLLTGAPGARLPEVDPIAPGLAAFPPDKFLVAIHKARSGLLSTGALLRPLAFWWVASNFTAQWLLNFAQIFGQPLRWVTYDPSSPGLVPRLESMLQQMGNAPWAVVPAGAAIEFREAVQSAADNPQSYVRDLADRLCDILILGQTLTTETPPSGAGSHALGRVHQSVRDEVVQAAGAWVDGVLTQQLVPALLRVNFGDTRFAPAIVSAPRPESDPLELARRDQLLLAGGVPLPRRWFYQRHNIPEPTPDDTLHTAPPAPPSPSDNARA